MKPHLLTLLILLLLLTASANAGWFGSDERQRRIETEQQLQAQRQATGYWQITSGILGITCIILLVVGTAIGAKARKAVDDE